MPADPDTPSRGPEPRGRMISMLFRQAQWPGLADGSITVAFRRWRRPTVRAGGTLKSPGGLLQIDEVTVIEPADITDADAAAAGFADAAAVRDELGRMRPEGGLHRVRFHRLGDDPRIALRSQSELDAAELTDLRRRLGRLEWAVPVLRLIEARPATVSTELAAELGLERQPFKQRVRRLKELGLTESLEIGYRLSPRGAAVLRTLD
jgi:hypothetical protein